MEIPKVLVADPISERGVSELAEGGALEVTVMTGLKEEQLLEIIPQFSALVVRSQTKVNARVIDAATKLKVVGRAGVGVDNVDVEAATKRGIIVMNTPGGNTISTAEHAFSLLVSTARSIPQAHASMKAGKWDRKKYEGVELYGKTLAILGMGRIGTEFARRAMAFGMRVLAYDPYLSETRARALQVELVEHLDDILPSADFITMHMPLTDETHHMLDAKRLALCKKGVRIVNCARGGLIDEAALGENLKSGHVAAAALDVYEVEPPPADYALRDLPNLVMTPHLGASTAEAQENVGIEVAQQIRAALIDGEIRNAVNMPSIDAKTFALVKPYLALGDKLGRFVAQFAPHKRNDSITITYGGSANDLPTDSITRAVLTAFLKSAGGDEINTVNVRSMATALGLEVREVKSSEQTDFNEWLHVAVLSGETKTSVGGTFFGHTPRIVRLNSRPVEATPSGILLVLENNDVPGMVGLYGGLLGKHGVNIAGMSLSRNEAGGLALVVLNLDAAPPQKLLDELLATENIHSARVIQL
jgi:D-3-phosphoglycerate dehydrogenase